ncbi:hypothetical protein O1611_g2700 [Lasiodiplodia mahajangana]|uniref:Uncharacterized protein n=1 Tax=Lasiodiplodia mahajangana TaxID=1108764 RepID=A0ACC2JU63_9PEZI|nr:hypothetical protein O1611_g2700 [Lasiodiplodia mahajangana]
MDSSKVEESLGAFKDSKEEIEHKQHVIEEAAKKRGIAEEQIVLFRQFTEADADWHRAMRKKLMRKVDIHLLPLLVLMYLLNFLDRSNLAQARLGTLEQDLGMKGTDFNLATSILFIFLMSSWYTRGELAYRIAWFYSGSSLANAFGGLIGAGVLSNLSGAHGITGWRWLFIIEGTITIGVAIIAAFILPNYPANTKWLTPEEQAYAQWRLVDDTGEADVADSISVKEGVKLAFKDPKLYLFTLLQHVSLLSQAFQYFFPTIVKTLGFGTIETLLLTAPVWIATFLVSLVVTYTSGRFADRSIHIICLMLISVAGNIIAVSTLNTGARFFAENFLAPLYSFTADSGFPQIFLLPIGAVTAYQIILAWVANSFPRPLVKRSACISVANLVGNSANIYGSYMYPASDGPRYLPGGAATAGVAFLVAVVALVARLVLKRENKKLAEREASEPEAGAVDGGFRYIL